MGAKWRIQTELDTTELLKPELQAGFMLRPTNRRPCAPGQPGFSSLATALLTERVLRMGTSYMLRPHCYRCRVAVVAAYRTSPFRAPRQPGTGHVPRYPWWVRDDWAAVSPYPGGHGRRPGIAPGPLRHNAVVQSGCQAKEKGFTGESEATVRVRSTSRFLL